MSQPRPKPIPGNPTLTMAEYADSRNMCVTAEEFSKLNLPSGGTLAKEAQTQRYIMSIADADRDGNLSGKEFNQLALAIRKRQPHAFFSATRDGEFSLKEAVTILLTCQDIAPQDVHCYPVQPAKKGPTPRQR